MIRIVVASIVALAVGWAFYKRRQSESDLNGFNKSSGRMTALVEPLLLPIYLFALSVTAIAANGFAWAATSIVASYAMLFLYISVYFAVLLCALPLLRRFISAKACATLWLLPNLLYLSIYINNTGMSPFIVITLPRQWLMIFALVWVIGFVCVLLGQIISHLLYRRVLLKEAVPVRDADALSRWEDEQKRRGMKRSIPMLISKNTNTPVSIGCFAWTLRLVLPQRDYAQEELALIFRHELRHIQRLDIRTKAFLGFCTAMCWLNPLMWIARRRVSDDLELSCDEAVLADADDAARRQYAKLLLDTTGGARGYTTRLSATAASLRYRLRNIVKPRKLFPGTAAVGIAMLVLILGSGSFALADSGGTIKTIILDKAPAENAVDAIATYNWSDGRPGYGSVYGWDETALGTYIASLRVKQVYVRDYPQEGRRQIYITYAEKEGDEIASMTRIVLCEGVLRANIPYDDYGNLVYILEDEIDWGYIESLLDFDAADPDPAPHPPEMMMYFNDEVNVQGKLMHASKTILSVESAGEEQEVDEHVNDLDVGGVHGYPVTRVRLYFSYEPSGDYEILVEDWERAASYSVFGGDLTDGVLELAPYSAHYTVYGRFATVRDTAYEMKFTFDVELPDE
ncbi:MAG TPA: M56 family metallopeptidase [Clostridia bacterium]|nr:M56 family metallopeptidase [Clostridia bacterium]